MVSFSFTMVNLEIKDKRSIRKDLATRSTCQKHSKVFIQSKQFEIIKEHLAGANHPFFLIAGPCVIESKDLLFEVAEELLELKQALGITVFFKSSFDKANRSSVSSFRGPGIDEGLKHLQSIKSEFGLPLLTDIHLPEEASIAAEVVDILQIPAFLSRQTDLILAAAETSKWVNIKKGQFMAPEDATILVKKFESTGSNKVSICERGYTFGYNNLVVDMRAFEIMRQKEIRVVFDATHSTQLPGGGEQSGGQREMADPLARAACAVGIDGLFTEVHPNPPKAKSDSTNQMFLKDLKPMISNLLKIDALVKGRF